VVLTAGLSGDDRGAPVAARSLAGVSTTISDPPTTRPAPSDEPGDEGEAPVDVVAGALFGLPLALMVAGLAVVTVARVGIGAFPDMDLYVKMAQRFPESPNLPPEAQYTLFSPIGVALAHATGLTTRTGWFVLHAGVAGFGMAAIGLKVRARYGDLAARFSAVTLSSSTVPVVLLSWLGSYDVYGIVLTSAIVVTESPVVAALFGFVLAFANFEQAIVAVAVLAVLAATGVFGRLPAFVGAGAGLVIGRALLTAHLHALGITHDRLAFLQAWGTGGMVKLFLRNAPLIVATVQGAAVVLIIMVAGTRTMPTRARVMWLVALSVPVVVSSVGLDQTRVAALIGWPILFALALTAARRWPPRLVRRVGLAMVALALFFPAVYVWEGAIHGVGWTDVRGRLHGTSPNP
jgi:hypothetical protein